MADRREEQRCRALMLLPGSIFVFGSNLAGVHGAGAAKDASDFYGAKRGVGVGRTGNAYAIPTKRHWRSRGLPLGEIAHHVADFLAYANGHPELQFAVTRIGCGFAGHREDEIAPLFAGAPERCDLPDGWREMSVAAGSVDNG